MKIPFKYIILFLLPFCGLTSNGLCSEEVPNDSVEAWDNSRVDYRYPSSDTIKYYQTLPEYDYSMPNESEGLLSQLWRWLASFLSDKSSYFSWVGWLILALAVMALLAIVIRLFDIPIKGLFVFSRSTKITDLNFSSGGGDLEKEKLENLLQNFIRGGAYREATRILFLLTLRNLNHAGLIKWNDWKTDREYYYEISKPELKTAFLSVMKQYEYVWYGKFNPEGQYFEQLKQQFEHFNIGIDSIKTKV